MVNDGELVGLVVGNEASNFSVGANVGLVGMLAMNQQFDEVDELVKSLQDTLMAMRFCEGPVVIAPRGMALGGGCEIVMHGDSVRASAESYIGLVELGVGLIPAAGGCKEMAMRFYGSIPPQRERRPVPLHGAAVPCDRDGLGRHQRRGEP